MFEADMGVGVEATQEPGTQEAGRQEPGRQEPCTQEAGPEGTLGPEETLGRPLVVFQTICEEDVEKGKKIDDTVVAVPLDELSDYDDLYGLKFRIWTHENGLIVCVMVKESETNGENREWTLIGEGRQILNKSDYVPLLPNMVLSNETERRIVLYHGIE